MTQSSGRTDSAQASLFSPRSLRPAVADDCRSAGHWHRRAGRPAKLLERELSRSSRPACIPRRASSAGACPGGLPRDWPMSADTSTENWPASVARSAATAGHRSPRGLPPSSPALPVMHGSVTLPLPRIAEARPPHGRESSCRRGPGTPSRLHVAASLPATPRLVLCLCDPRAPDHFATRDPGLPRPCTPSPSRLRWSSYLPICKLRSVPPNGANIGRTPRTPTAL
jgi:hypothetical protein